CHAANKTCPKNHIWNNHICRCVKQHDFTFPSQYPGSYAFDGVNDICGPNKELDDETCQCVCKGTLIPSSCGPNRVMDRDSCQCVCKLLPTSCGPNTVFDKDSCQCACSKVCPRHQPLNPDKCTCECTESPNRCFLRGRRFQHQTCSHKPSPHELLLVNKNLLHVSKLNRQAVGRNLDALIAACRQLWLSQARMPDEDKAPLLDAPITFGHTVDKMLQCSHHARESPSAQTSGKLAP
ncbi:UNVERIFIED_CONTAM: hypothetical protein FKN15_042297, partial [Acipenser sinensis]